MYSIRYYYLDDAIIEMATSTMQMVRSTTELIAHLNKVLFALNSYLKYLYNLRWHFNIMSPVFREI